VEHLPEVPHTVKVIALRTARGVSYNGASDWRTGSAIAALVVRPGFNALTRLDILPQVGGYLLARVIVEGVRR
jgi:hypothetical protein